MATFRFDKTLPATPEETARQLYLLVEYLSYVINALDEENFTQAIIEKLNKDNETVNLKKYSTIKNLVDGVKNGALRGIETAVETDLYQMGECAVSLGSGTKVPGDYCYAEGYNNISGARYNHVEGYGCETTNYEAQHVEGYETKTNGYGKGVHVEGYKTEAYGDGGHAEGCECKATGYYSAHAEGHKTHANGTQGCHTEGIETYAEGYYGIHGEGNKTTVKGYSGAHVEGVGCFVNGHYGTHGEGCKVQVSSCFGAHGEGDNTIIGNNSYGLHVEGNSTINNGHDGGHVEGTDGLMTDNSYYGCHLEGNRCIVGKISARCGTHGEGDNTITDGQGCHNEGSFNIISDSYGTTKGCHNEGRGNFARGVGAHVEGVANFAGAYITDTATISSVTYQSELQISTALNYTTTTEIDLFASVSTLKLYNNVDNSTNITVSSTYSGLYEVGQPLIFCFNSEVYRGTCTSVVNVTPKLYNFTLDKLITMSTSDTATKYNLYNVVYPVQAYTNATNIYVNDFVYPVAEKFALINDTVYGFSTTSAAKAIVTLDKNISGTTYCLANDYSYRLYPANNLTLLTDTTYSMDLEPIAHTQNYITNNYWTNYNLRNCEPNIMSYYNKIHAISWVEYSECYGAHADGFKTSATAIASHASGEGTKATEEAQFVCGKYNAVNSNAVFVVGWGTDENNRTNLFEVLNDGTARLNGSPIVTEARLQELGLI